jgi:uncharacterized damage-inducible protein DinB
MGANLAYLRTIDHETNMSRIEMRKQLEFVRKKTLDLLDGVAKLSDATKILGWRPGAARAHIAWQLMHIAATDDRHLNVRLRGGEAHSPEFVRRFAGGSSPDDDIPTVEVIRGYLTERRAAMLELLASAADEQFSRKPFEASPYTLEEWFRVWIWHEAHHQGQAHLTLNLYRALSTQAA